MKSEYTISEIRLAKRDTANEPRVLLLPSNYKWEQAGFNKREIKYINLRLDEKQEIITIRQVDEVVYIVILPSTETENLYINREKLRRAGHSVMQMLKSQSVSSVIFSGGTTGELMDFSEGALLSSYTFLRHKSPSDKKKTKGMVISLYHPSIKSNDINALKHKVNAVCITRSLVNEPPNYLTAQDLAQAAKHYGNEHKVKVEIWDKVKIKSMKMGGLLAVNQGSMLPPTFTIMEYKPKNAVNKKPFVIVGKGVVYDTGGLSLKPTPNSMDSMKCDMAGAGVVIGAMYGMAALQLPVYVVGLIPATDNRPGMNAYVPGDVITMMSGKTVEMLNADAEGRMILADALHYAKKYNPELVLDFATLTGAAAAAIGNFGIVAMGNAKNGEMNLLKKAGEEVYERLVEFPMWDEYKDLLKSDIADMKNIGGAVAGAITAGKFLEYYTDYPWIHFDIAGPAYISSADSYRGKNGTGIGVRLLLEFLKEQSKISSRKK